ncbi:MAG: hypothetical protein ACRC7O_13945 [Fimbriiglobus sp.]
MTDPDLVVRPVARWVRVWGIATATVALLLLFVLGGFVTSFRVGMSDPVWPTEPWFLLVNGQVWKSEPQPGFLIEHTHRAAGWIVGLMMSVFVLAVWASEPSRLLRWLGLAAILVLLVGYGEFHRGMMKAEAARKEQKSLDEILLPVTQGVFTIVGVALCAGACAAAVAGGALGQWTRVTAVTALIAVMIQGLLGGFRVFLDALYGTQLAAYHGTFGQVTFAVIVAAVALCGPRRAGDVLPASDRRRLGAMALGLPFAVFVQLVWGVWVRHTGSPIAQRLHVLTAFVVTGLAVWLAVRALATPAGRRQLGFTTYHLLGILAVQILFGVEAWMQKFGTSGPQGLKPPEFRDVTILSAGVRTFHVVIGTALLAAAAAMALRVRRLPVDGREPATEAFGESTVRLGEPVSGS